MNLNPFDSVTALWALLLVAVGVVAFALGFLLGEADGFRQARSREAYDAGRLAGFEEGLEALAVSTEEHDGFVRCPLCRELERTEDMVGGVCLTCADGITWSQHARRGSVEVESGPVWPTWSG